MTTRVVPGLVCTVILNWNGLADTVACIRSCQQLAYPHNTLLVVDNGSTDGSVAGLRELFPDLEIIETGANLGDAGGLFPVVGGRRLERQGSGRRLGVALRADVKCLAQGERFVTGFHRTDQHEAVPLRNAKPDSLPHSSQLSRFSETILWSGVFAGRRRS